MADRSDVQKKQATRYAMLRKLHDATRGLRDNIVGFFDLATEEGLTDDEAQDTYEYLSDEGLLQPMTLGGGVSITHAGVREVEQSILNPRRATDHFSPAVINIYGAVGGVQTGAHSTMHSTQQNMASREETAAALHELQPYTRALPDEARAEVEELLRLIEEEATREKPNRVRLKAFSGELSRMLPTAPSSAVADVISRLSIAIAPGR
jgi:hypothetical protein